MPYLILLLPPDRIDTRLVSNELGEPMFFDSAITAAAWLRDNPPIPDTDSWQLISVQPDHWGNPA